MCGRALAAGEVRCRAVHRERTGWLRPVQGGRRQGGDGGRRYQLEGRGLHRGDRGQDAIQAQAELVVGTEVGTWAYSTHARTHTRHPPQISTRPATPEALARQGQRLGYLSVGLPWFGGWPAGAGSCLHGPLRDARQRNARLEPQQPAPSVFSHQAERGQNSRESSADECSRQNSSGSRESREVPM
eukprot:COSAG01_NODE_3105_length_6577_cov_4.068077_5_plen_186_part_00